jgi:hypothetical protein
MGEGRKKGKGKRRFNPSIVIYIALTSEVPYVSFVDKLPHKLTKQFMPNNAFVAHSLNLSVCKRAATIVPLI